MKPPVRRPSTTLTLEEQARRDELVECHPELIQDFLDLLQRETKLEESIKKVSFFFNRWLLIRELATVKSQIADLKRNIPPKIVAHLIANRDSISKDSDCEDCTRERFSSAYLKT